jgi:aryl-alcohol dehydrogenase-like predicted oxidoreductase
MVMGRGTEGTMIPRAMFGSTGHESSRTIFGAAALASVTQAEADRTMETVLAYGLNHIDTAASYGDSEVRLGPWIERHRNEVFLATKTGERGATEARDEIHRSLERLRTDHVDLIQLHNLVDEAEWRRALGPGGALEAAIAARDEGLVRFIGVTGHGVEVAQRHLQSLERFPFDSVLLPYSYVMMQNTDYAATFEDLAAVCQERGVAIQTIKAITRRPWGAKAQDRATWYEPLDDPTTVALTVGWVLGRPDFFLNTVGDVHLLPLVLEAAAAFRERPSAEEMLALLEEKEMEPLFT